MGYTPASDTAAPGGRGITEGQPVPAASGDMTLPKLTVKQRRFVGAYLLEGNATQAAIEAGYSVKTARFMGAENLTKPNIRAHVDAAQQRQLARSQQRQDDVCDAMRKLAYTDRTLMFDDDCNLLPLSQWPQALRDCVEGVEVVIRNVEAGDGHPDRVVKVKLSSKIDALREVARMEGRYPQPARPDDGAEAAHQVILTTLLEGRKRWREWKEQEAIEAEASR